MRIIRHACRQRLQVADDYLKDVVEIVRDRARAATDGLQLARLDQRRLALPQGGRSLLDLLLQAFVQSSQRFLGALLARNVARDRRAADDGPATVPDRRGRPGNVDRATILPLSHGLERLDRPPSPKLRQDMLLLAEPVGRNEDSDGAADHLVRAIAEQSLRAAIPARNGAVERLADDRVLGRGDEDRK